MFNYKEYCDDYNKTIKINELFTIARKNSNRYKKYFTDEKLFKLFDSSLYSFVMMFKDKTGATGHHHNFFGGLLVHTFEMLDILWDTYVQHPENAMKFNLKKDPDNKEFNFGTCAIAILYHDYGKLFEYKHSDGPNKNGKFSIAYPMIQKGHIYMSTERFTKDADKAGVGGHAADEVKHCILAHHSKLEWGSPVKPITPEARIVCACDLISAGNASGKEDYFDDYVRNGSKLGNQEDYYNNNVIPNLEK